MKHHHLKHLETFLTIVETGSFSEAAHRLYLSQSTVSEHVRLLEDTFGCTLFDRTAKKKCVITPAGHLLYQYAQTCLQLNRDVCTQLQHIEMPHLRIGASSIPARALLPRLLAHYAQRHPEHRLTVRRGDSQTVVQQVLNQTVDIGLIGTAVTCKGLSARPVGEDTLVLITPHTPDFAALKQRQAVGEALRAAPFIFRETGSGTQTHTRLLLNHYLDNPDALSVYGYVEDSALIQTLVEQGRGIAILSPYALSPSDDAHLTFTLDTPLARRTLWAIYRAQGPRTAAADTFLDICFSNNTDIEIE